MSKFPNFMLILGPNAANFWANITTLVEIESKYNCKVVAHLKKENRKAPYAVYVDENVQTDYNTRLQRELTKNPEHPIAILSPKCANYYTVSSFINFNILCFSVSPTRTDVPHRIQRVKPPFGARSMASTSDGNCSGRTGRTMSRYGRTSFLWERMVIMRRIWRQLRRFYPMAMKRLSCRMGRSCFVSMYQASRYLVSIHCFD